MYARPGAGPPATVTYFQNVGRTGIESSCGTPTRPIAPPGCGHKRREHRLLVSNAFQRRVRTEIASELPHALHCCVAELADDVRTAKLLAQSDPVGIAAEQGDAFSAA